MLALILAEFDRSSSTDASVLSLSPSETPPIRSAAFRQHVHRGAGNVAIANGVRVHGHEEVRPRDARTTNAIAQNQELVRIPREHGMHAVLLVDASRERTRDREHDILLLRPVVPDGARVLSAVARIHGDDDRA